MSDFILLTNDEVLEHHGILGQKWGIRRYQNKDGSLTAAGRQKYNKFDSKSYKEERREELANKGIKGLKSTILTNNEALLLKNADKWAYKANIKQDQLSSKIKDAIELGDSKSFGKLIDDWTKNQTRIRYDEILQNKEKIEPLAKAFIKTRTAQMVAGMVGVALFNDYFKEDTKNWTEATTKAKKDAEEYKKQFK